MSKPRIFVTQPVAESALARLRAVADVEVNPDSSRVPAKSVLIEGCKRNDILFSLLHDVVDKEVLAANPKLRAVNSMVITPDHIDVAEATRLRIPVTNIPAVVTDATADIAFGLMLSVGRRIVEGDRLFRGGMYPGSQSNHLVGAGVSGRTLGLIGGGRIGQAVARRAQGFGMTVLYADPKRLPAETEQKIGMTHVTQDELLAQSDYVSLHVQLASDTRHLMSTAQFARMKPSAFVINTSRGPIIDEVALVKALQQGVIAGAGLDVYEFEPKVSPELIAMPNVVLTPHLGSAVFALRENMAHVVTDNVLAIIEGRVPPNCINPQVLGG